jgi:D-beta-D-heptose 7-phosphate kinase / D-beta-D-heptose 1-phosphate adenosyltransferase
MEKILVIGDPIIDMCLAGHICVPTAEVPMRLHGDTTFSPGGACNLVCNLKTLGADVIFCAVAGGVDIIKRLVECFHELGLGDDSIFFDKVDGPPPSVRSRIMDGRRMLIRHDTDGIWAPGGADEHIQKTFDRAVAAHGDDIAMVVVSDYAKGMITPGIMEAVHAWADPRRVGVVFQGKPRDTLDCFRGNWALVLNAPEFAMLDTLLDREDGACDGNDLPPLMERAGRVLGCENIVVTLEREGAVWCGKHEGGWESKFIPSPSVVHIDDPTGCGDTFLAALCVARNEGYGWARAVVMANVAGGYTASRLGTTCLTRPTWRISLGRFFDASFKVMDAYTAAGVAERFRERDLDVGLVNGCFDVLHPGHLKVIADARRHSDVLFVLVATDNHVRRLKGYGRPLQPLGWREANLAALQDVDAVIPFQDEAQLEETIALIRPVVMTKGEEYRGSKITGAEVVEEQGGEIRFVDVYGYSTSDFAERLRERRDDAADQA